MPPAQGITVFIGIQQVLPMYARAPRIIAADAHMAVINIQPQARLRPQQMLMSNLGQLIGTVAADGKMEVAADVPIIQRYPAGITAQAIFTRENIRGMHLLQ